MNQFVGGPSPNPNASYPSNVQGSIHSSDAKPVGYVRIDSPLNGYVPTGGTTVNPNNVQAAQTNNNPWAYTPIPSGGYYPNEVPPSNAVNPPGTRLPSTHWSTSRGNTANLTNHWSGNNLNADLTTNLYPTPLVYPLTGGGWDWPHACHSCPMGGFTSTANVPPSTRSTLHWVEPGPNTPTPGDWFYNAPTLWTDPIGGQLMLPISTSFANFIASVTTINPGSCQDANFYPIIGGTGNLAKQSIPRNLKELTDSVRHNHVNSNTDPTNVIVTTKITHSKDERQEVTITPNINLT